MKMGSVILLSCLAAGISTGCVSIGNTGMDALSEEEKAELRQELDAAAQEIQAELDSAIAEAASALDEAKAEAQKELGENAEWIGEMIRGEQERPRRVIWKKGSAEAEIADNEEFVETLSLEDWKASAESTEGLTEDATYTIQWKKSIGLLDGWKAEYVDIGSFTVYQDSNLVTARIHIMDSILGQVPGLFAENTSGSDMDDWFVIVYEAPEGVTEALRR